MRSLYRVVHQCWWWPVLLLEITALAQPRQHSTNMVYGSPTLRLHGVGDLRYPIRLSSYLEVFGARSDKVNQAIRVSELSFRPFLTSGYTDASPESLYWFRLRMVNTHPTDTLYVVFYAGDGTGLKTVSGESTLAQSCQPWPFRWNRPDRDRYQASLIVLPGTTGSYYVETTSIIRWDAFVPKLYPLNMYRQLREQRTLNQRFPLAFSAVLFGVCLFLGIIGFIMLVADRDPVYGWWASYLWSNALYLYVSTDFEFNLNTLPYSMQVLLGPIGHMAQLFYFLFLDTVLDLRLHDRLLHQVLRATIWVLVGALIISVFAIGTRSLPFLSANNMFLFLTLLIGIFTLVRLAWRPVPENRMVIIGAAVLTTFILVAVGVAITGEGDNSRVIQTPNLIYGLGVFGELIFFSIALSRRAISIRETYNRQEAELQQRINEVEMDKLRSQGELQQRINEVEMDKLRNQSDFDRNLNELQFKLSEAKMATLRSQMNPHFMFNALNSIQSFINKNRSEIASDYLAKFALLLRKVLENSRAEQIKLATELETIELYLELEAMRFQHKVRYRIRVNQKIDTESVLLPPLLLQPFVENAIWHGLMHKPDGGQVDIEIEEFPGRRLHITVTDDGIGRAKAAEYRSQSLNVHKSSGTEITAERIDLINQLHGTRIRASTVDLVSPTGDALGTKVIIELQT